MASSSGVRQVVVDFADARTRGRGSGWTAVYDSRTTSVKFKTVKKPSVAYFSGLRTGDVLAWIESPDAQPLSGTKEDKTRLDAYVKHCIASSSVLRIGVSTPAAQVSRRTPRQLREQEERERIRLANERARRSETPEQRKARLDTVSAAMTQARGNETPEQRRARQDADAASKIQARAKETPLRRSTRRQGDQEAHKRRRLEADKEEREKIRKKDRLRKAIAKEAMTAEEHLAFVEDQRDYLRKWRRQQHFTDEGKARLEAYRDYWRRYWENLSDENWAIKRQTDQVRKAAARASQGDLAKEVAAFRRYAARKRKLLMETPEEKLARLGAEDVRILKRQIIKGLQLADIQGLADHLKQERVDRATKKGIQVLKKSLKSRLKPTTPEEVRQREKDLSTYFQGLISDAPTRTCLSCVQLFFGRQTKKFTPKNLQKLEQEKKKVDQNIAELRREETEENSAATRQKLIFANTFNLALQNVRDQYEEAKEKAVEHPLLWGRPDRPSVRICKRCWNCLRKGVAPKLGVWNHLEAVPQPDSIKILNDLECQLVSPRRPFMKIVSLPRGGQKGVIGGVINVPADIEATMARLLPLNLEEGQLIAVELKKRLLYKSVDQKKLVSPSRMVEALVDLKKMNRHFANVEIRDPKDWEAEVAEESPEFADALVQPSGEEPPQPDDAALPPNLRRDYDEDEADDDEGEEEMELELGEEGRPLPVHSIVDSALLPVEGARIGNLNKIAHLKDAARKQKRPVVQLAPSEGMRPLPFFLDPEVEELAFPSLFPDGTNSARTDRLIPITLGEYLKNRMTLSERRFVASHPFIFFSLYRLEYERLLSSISISLNKATMENKFGMQLKDVDFTQDEFVDQFIASDGGYRWMKQSRGSPAYWKSTLLDITAMCRQLGPPTLFLTLSADDRHWPDTLGPIFEMEYKRAPSAEDLDTLSERQRNHLLRKYPDVAARLFHNRVNTFFEKLLSDPAISPFGRKVEDYFHRFEWQHRGSPHTHALLWLKDAPVLGRDPEEDFTDLADELIHTSIPDKDEDPELHYLVTSKQTHRHTPSCQKLDKPRFKLSAEEQAKLTPLELKQKKEDAHCRFDYERPPCAATTLHHDLTRLTRDKTGSRPGSPTSFHTAYSDDEPMDTTAVSSVSGSPSKSSTTSMRTQKSDSTQILPVETGESGPPAPAPVTPASIRRVRSLLNEHKNSKEANSITDSLSDSFCADLSIDDEKSPPPSNNEKEFQTSQVRLEMRRLKGQGYINNYNPAILRLWKANMDIQMVTNTWAACQYICNYVAKSEKELGETMTEVMRSIPEGTAPIQRLRKIANAFMGARSVSAQEAIHRILGLYMLKKSREVKFLSTGYPKNRHRMLKSRAQRQKLDPTKPVSPADLFVAGAIEKYQQRDVSDRRVAEMSFATFCAFYEGNSKRESSWEDEEDGDEGCADLEAPADDDAGDKGSGSSDDEQEEESGDDEAASAAPSRPASPSGTRPPAPASAQASPTGNLPETIKLLSSHIDPKKRKTLDILYKRNKKRVLRFCSFGREDQAEEGAYSRLVLFLPFENEEDDFNLENSPYSSYQEWAEKVKERLEPGLAEFDSYGYIVTKSMEEMTKKKREKMVRHMGGAEEDGAADAEDDDDPAADDAIDAFLDPDDLQLDVLQGIVPEADDATPTRPFSVRSGFQGCTKEEIVSQLEHIEAKMNADQAKTYDYACTKIANYKQAQAEGRRYKGRPVFISGPGGTGKSFLLKALRLKIHLELHEDLNDLTSTVLAPTGCAAVNVDGDTIHHGLSLPIQQNFATVDYGLSAKKLQSIRNTYDKTHAFLFDEVSMISSNMLWQINDRLRAITGTMEPDVHFGGLLTFWFGDLRQLPPVAAPRPFEPPSAKVVGASAAAIHLWKNTMVLCELRKIERQKGDQAYAELLNRVREGQHTDEDLKTLESRVIGRPGLEKAAEDPEVRDAVHLFATNVQVDNYNQRRLTRALEQAKAAAVLKDLDPESPSVHLLVKADDDFVKDSAVSKDSFKGNFESLVPKGRDCTGGLPAELHLVRGLRVMLRKNVDVRDGLVNGSCGTVVHWSKTGKVAFVKFDKVGDRLVGQATRQKLSKYLQEGLAKDKSIVPILPEEFSFKAAKGTHRLRRVMLPLVMCWATTIHKAQGMSLERVVIDLSSNRLPVSMAYVALSRVTSLKGLYLLGFAAGAIKADPKAGEEYDRLLKSNQEIYRNQGQTDRLNAILNAESRVSFEQRSSPDKACGSSVHGKQRSTAQVISRAVKKLVLPGEKQARAEKKAEHVAGGGLLSSKGLPDSARSIIDLFTSSTQRKFSKNYFLTTRMKELELAVKDNAQVIVQLVEKLREAELVPLQCKARAAQTDNSATGLLYTSLLNQMRPVSVSPDGNCMFHSFATLLVGRGDTGHHKLFRALSLIFVLAFPDHIKALILADSLGMHSPLEVDGLYKDLCWKIFRLGTWGEKFSLYAMSWILNRPVHIYVSCFEWSNQTETYNVARPRGGVELDRDLDALRAAFANPDPIDSPLPEWTDYSAALTYPRNRLPAAIFLNNSHYVPLLFRQGVKRAEVIQPVLRSWWDDLGQIRRAHPLPGDLDALRVHLGLQRRPAQPAQLPQPAQRFSQTPAAARRLPSVPAEQEQELERSPRRVPLYQAPTLDQVVLDLPQRLQSIAHWLLKEFTHPQRESLEMVELSREEQMALAALAKTRRDAVRDLIRHLRRNFPPRLYDHGRFEVEGSVEEELYQGLQGVLKPIVTTGDGNCWQNAVSLALVGGEGMHQLIRALITYSLLAAEDFFLPFYLQNPTTSSFTYVNEVFRSYYLGEWAGNIHQVVTSVILGRDIHLFVRCNRKREVAAKQFRGNPDSLSLQQLHGLYQQKTVGLAGHILIPGASVLLGGLSDPEPVRLFYCEPHYTALLPNPLNHNLAHIPVPHNDAFGNFSGDKHFVLTLGFRKFSLLYLGSRKIFF